MRPACGADQQRVALRIVARPLRAARHLDQPAVGVLAPASRNTLRDDPAAGVAADMDHFSTGVGLLEMVGHRHRIELPHRIVAQQHAAGIFPRDRRAGLDLRPRQAGVLAAQSALGDEVVDAAAPLLVARIPVLDGRVFHLGVALDDDLHHGGVQLVLVAPRGGTPFQIPHVGPFVGDDERAFELSRTLGVDAEVGRQLHRTAHPFGNVAERSVGEDRRVERRIVVVGAGHHAAQVFLDEIGIVADRLRDRTEDDSLLGERLLESGLDRHGVHDGIDGHARQLHLLLQGDAQLVERAFEFGVDLVHGAQFGTHPGRSVIDDVLEIDLRNAEVRPRRRLHLEPVAVGPQARLGHPLRFALLGRDQAHDLLAQAARNRLGLDVGGETVLVLPAFYLFYDVILF